MAIVDINDDEIKNISLQNEIQSFNDVYKKVSEKLKLVNLKQNFKEEFQTLIKNEISKINSNYETVPNYIYSANVLESQLALYSFFNEKFLLYLEYKDPEAAKLEKIINDNMTKSYLLLIKIIFKLYPIITEKIEKLKNQLEEALKLNQNVNYDLNGYDDKMKQMTREKDLIITQCKDQINFLQVKINQLENENKIMTEKFLKNANDIITNNKINNKKNEDLNLKFNNTYVNNNNINNQLSRKKSKDKLTRSNSGGNINIINNNVNMINNNIIKTPSQNIYQVNRQPINNNNINPYYNSPVCNRVFTIKMMKEMINEIYKSKEDFDKKSDENKLPRETLEQHMYTYLNQKYGLKSIIIEWASNIINGIKIFSSEDSEICLFGKILRNELEENSRFVLGKLKQSIIDILNFFFKNKFPLKPIEDINSMINQRINGFIFEEEWKKIISYLYEEPDAKILENKIYDLIKKKYYKNKFDTEKKLTREEIINLSKTKDEFNIPFKDLIKILHEFQIKLREKYLKNFVIIFKKFDTDNNGIINEEEFINMLYNMNIFGNKLKENVVTLLTLIDPNNNKQITFSECVNLFSTQPYYENDGNTNGTILDKICLEENI